MLSAFVALLALIIILTVAWLYGAHRWDAGTQALRARLEAARLPVTPRVVDSQELQGLPAPVQHYFRTVLKEGQPMVAGVRVQHQGTFNMGETAEQWQPFTSEQQVVTRRPGFDWAARIAILPGLTVRVHDAYVAGAGLLHASLLGLFTLVHRSGTDEVARDELMRFFAEAAWYPTALLPSQGVCWAAVDAHSAHGILTDGAVTLTLLFTFNEQGLIDTVRAEARGRTVNGQVIPTPWHGRFWNYTERGGMRVPLEGEVAWLLPAGARPYWRGRITALVYEFAR